jgi:hypothetical protein
MYPHRSCLHPPSNVPGSREAEQLRWPDLPPNTPRWAADLCRDFRAEAERDMQVVWPNFSEPDPLPPVVQGQREAWSAWGSKDGDHRTYQTLVTPTHWAEVRVSPGGQKTCGTEYPGTIKQYATQQEALRAAHYSLCRHLGEVMIRSLRGAHGQTI